MSSQITRAEADQFQPELEIPHCSLDLQWTGQGEVKPLLHKVTLKGAMAPKDFFYICYYPPAAGEDSVYDILLIHLHYSTGGRHKAEAPTGGEVLSSTSSASAEGEAKTHSILKSISIY